MMRPALLACCCLAFAIEGESAPDRWQTKAREIFSEVIAMRTAEGHGEVPRMAQFLARELRTGGFGDDAIEIVPVDDTVGLIVRYESRSLSKARPILLLAHMDVVEADPADWVRDPFRLIEEDGFFFGRGTYDNKFGVTMLTTTFLRLRAEGFEPDRDLILVFTGDEETTQNTTAVLAARADLREAEFALNSDGGKGRLAPDGTPIAYFLQASEKTYASFDITIRNEGGHSSMPRTSNAIYELADALKRIENYRFPVRTNPITTGYMAAMGEVEPGEVGAALAKLAVDPTDKSAADVLWHRPEYVGMTRTTCVATMLDAGHADNALPQRASATVNCRIFPDVDPESVRTRLAALAGPSAEVSVIDKAFLAVSSPLNEEITAAVRAAIEARVGRVPVIPEMSPGYTDGSFFRAAGVPTYGVNSVFIRAEDSFAHGLNERIPVASLDAGLDQWYRLLNRLARR